MGSLLRYFATVTIVATVACTSVSGCAVFQGCFQGNPERTFPVDALVLDRSAFPGTWVPSPNNPSVPSNAPIGGMESIDRVSAIFYSNGDIAVQEIHRFMCLTRAVNEFEAARTREYKDGEFERIWLPPIGILFQSKVAERFYLACGMGGPKPTCRFIGQYAEYYVYLNVHMSPEKMTLVDFEKIIKEMDRKFDTYLSH